MDIKQEILKKARANKEGVFWNENFRDCFWEYCKHHDVGVWDFICLVNGVSQEDHISLEEYEVSMNKIVAFNKAFRESKQRVEEELMRELQNEHQKEILNYETN